MPQSLVSFLSLLMRLLYEGIIRKDFDINFKKFAGNNFNKPPKNLLKILPKWNADINIENKIINKFFK